jgi:hypothetical protein
MFGRNRAGCLAVIGAGRRRGGDRFDQMICFAVGAPTPFADWCGEVCARLMTPLAGRPEILPANTLDEVALAAIRARGGSMLLKAWQPAEALCAALAASGRGFLVTIDDPFAAFSSLVAGYGLDPVAATRMAATGCAALVGYEAAPNAVVLRSDRHAGDTFHAARLIAGKLGLPLSAAGIAEAVADLPPFAAEPGGTAAWADDAAGRCPEFAIGALRAYRDYFAGRGWSEISWSRALFLLGDDPARPADGAVDLAGESRALLFGPFVALPSGGWRCRVTLAVSREAAEMRFSVEVLAGPGCVSLAAATVAPDRHGVCRATLAFAVEPHTEQPISLRIVNPQAAACGRLALIGAALTRQAGAVPGRPAPAEIPAELSAALGL